MSRCPYASERAPGGAKRERSAGSGRASASADAGGLETLTNELVASLRPTEMSEIRRRAVFEHIKQLAQECFGTAHTLVSAYGSVPLRAYLPDGDIDVCLLGDHRVIDKAQWTTKFRKHIEKAEAEADPPHEFAVSEVSVINAEVRLMKCIVDGMMVDVSANQFGGLASLGFLEEMNAFIGRDDLFVRSIILVKAWGFYEGRILGAHHALISTYALETLVLYIINKYHADLTCPLSVLHKLLSVFAEFDWEGYALTIHGPVAIEGIATPPDECLEGGLITEEFMRTMLSTYSCEFMRAAASSAPVTVKYMNIIDPLLPNNNLGRSVSCGNYRRVRAALKLGAQRLDALMASSAARDDVGVLRGFVEMFGNILRHRRLLYPLPHAPDTPGGCSHADEVSMTPMGMPTSAIALRSRSCLVEGTTPATALATHPHTRSVVDELQPRQLNMEDSESKDAEADESSAVAANHWPTLGDPPSPERGGLHKRSESMGSLSEQERGIHWGRWDALGDEQRVPTSDERRSIDDDSAQMSTSPPQSVSSDDSGEQHDSCDGADSKQPPIPEDATAPGINDIFTGCLDTIREHLAFGVFHHRRAHERTIAARRSGDDRRRSSNNNNRRGNGNRPPYNRSRNASRSNKASKSAAQQSFQSAVPPPPPPGVPPLGTAKRGYASDNNSTAVFEDMSAHFPHVDPAKEVIEDDAPRRTRSPRPSPTFPQAWSGVAKLPAKFMNEQPTSEEDKAVTMAAMLKKDIEDKLAVNVALTDTSSASLDDVAATPSTVKPSWGPKGSAPIDVLKANAEKPVVDDRPKTPALVAEDSSQSSPMEGSPGEHTITPQSDDSAAGNDSSNAQSKTKRVRSRKGKTRVPVVECEEAFPSLATGGAADAPRGVQPAKAWATLL